MFDGIQRACVNHSNHIGQALTAGLEIQGTTTDYNIDMKWTSMYKGLTGTSAWSPWGTPTPDVSPNYTFVKVSSTAMNTYLGTLQ
jgi:hypothetical protein